MRKPSDVNRNIFDIRSLLYVWGEQEAESLLTPNGRATSKIQLLARCTIQREIGWLIVRSAVDQVKAKVSCPTVGSNECVPTCIRDTN